MKRSDLVHALDAAARAADRKSTMPILASVRLTGDGRTLTIQATDLVVWVRTEVPSDFSGDVCVPAAPLLATVKGLGTRGRKGDGTEITLRQVGSSLEVVACGMSVGVAGCQKGADFPKWTPLTDATAVIYEGPVLREALAFALTAASQDETRFHLMSVALEGTRVLATDGHRLHITDGLPATPPVLVPKRAAQVLLRLIGAGAVAVAVGREGIRARIGSLEIFAKRTEGVFPPVDQVIPKEVARGITVGRDMLLGAIRAAGARCRENRGLGLVGRADGLWAVADHPEIGTFCTRLGDGLPVPWFVEVNPRYLTEVLETFGGDTVTLGVNGELDPFRIEEGSRVAVIMPMRGERGDADAIIDAALGVTRDETPAAACAA